MESGESSFKINSDELHDPQLARIAWLRAAYLAAFAVMGYRYILRPSLDIVRKQICEPEVTYIQKFRATIPPQDQPVIENGIMRISEPAWQGSWAFKMGRYVVFLPLAEDTTFYARIEEKFKGQEVVEIKSSEAWEWPVWPSFSIDPDEERKG